MTTVRMSAAEAAKTAVSRARSSGAPAVRRLSEGHRDQVRPGAGCDLAGVGPAQAGMPGRGGGLEQGLGGEVAARIAGRGVRRTRRRGLPRRMSMTAWLSLPRVSVHPAAASGAGRGEAVAEIAFGGGAQAGEYLAAAQQFQVGGVDVGGVHHGGPRAEHVLVVEQLGRARPRRPRGTSRSRRAARTCGCAAGRRAGAPRPRPGACAPAAPRGPSGWPRRPWRAGRSCRGGPGRVPRPGPPTAIRRRRRT